MIPTDATIPNYKFTALKSKEPWSSSWLFIFNNGSAFFFPQHWCT